jgi:hypothetical protein
MTFHCENVALAGVDIKTSWVTGKGDSNIAVDWNEVIVSL